MTKIWKKRTQKEVKKTVFDALDRNINYDTEGVLGVPASYLDSKVFNQDEAYLKDAPFLYSLIRNPNHIGCHTLGISESFFAGTQEIEKRLIDICAVDILKGEMGQHDGYVASGGTEANIEAIWIYRNYFMRELKAAQKEITIICSEDSHYSMDKAGNLLSLSVHKIAVDKDSRQLNEKSIEETINRAKNDGCKYYIVICNMMTTMFGSVDDIDLLSGTLEKNNCEYKLHVDGAYGGFYYPFTDENSRLTFENPVINSFTLDAHKMAQSPYGTGIFLIRKDFIHYVNTKEASYVEGEDYTLIGSRSGANAIAVWMILVKNGPHGWYEKVLILQERTTWFCKKLDEMGIDHYRHPKSNIVTIRSDFMNEKIAHKFGLVPDNHKQPNWHKVVIMDHVTIEVLSPLVEELSLLN